MPVVGGARIEVSGLTWRPAGRRIPVLEQLDLEVEPGEKVLLAGPSGSGKSTLLRAIAGLLQTADVGDLAGEVRIDGTLPQARPGQVGLLLQDPSAAVVAPRVGRDVAFGLENLQVPRTQMPERVRRALELVGFPYDEHRRTGSLSGGETQRLALAGALAMEPSVLLLDEPTSMLDADGAARVRRAVLDACDRADTTLVVVEHHLGPWLEHMDRCVVLDASGSLVADGPPNQVLSRHRDSLAAQGIWVPGLPSPEPSVVDAELLKPAVELAGPEPLVEAHEVTVRYRSAFAVRAAVRGRAALEEVSCGLLGGRALVLRGDSGAGKSTLLAVLAGLQEPDQGLARIHPRLSGRRGRTLCRLTSLELAARLAWVPQLPEHGLVRHTVVDELLLSSHALGREPKDARRRAGALLEHLGLSHLDEVSAHHLSGGEQRRLVVAAALVHGPAGILLDEPTVGQDRRTWAAVAGLCVSAGQAGTAVAVATHDRMTADLLGADPGCTLTLVNGRVS